MYRKCATDISAQNQRRVETALRELMLKQDFGDITVTDLCRKAGITRRIFYYLFNNKQDALYAMVDHAILDIESYMSEGKDQTLRLFLYWRDQKDLLDALNRNQLSGLLLERMIESVLREDYDIWNLFQAEDPQNRQDIIVFNFSGIMGLIFSWYASGFQKSPEQMAALMVQLMKYPLVMTKT